MKFLASCILAVTIFLLNSQYSSAYENEINNLSAIMADKISRAGKQKLAVVDFTDLQGNITELGRFLSEEFSVALAGAGKGFTVVDRIHLNSSMKEHKLSQSGLIDPSTARKLGKIAGVEALVTGTLTPFGDSVRISVKILNTETAEVIDANVGNIAKTKAIEELLARGIVTVSGTSDKNISSVSQTAKGSPNVWEDGVLLVEVESLKKSGKYIDAQMLFKNISGNPINIDLNAGPSCHMLDENGSRWEFDNDTAELRYGRNMLPGNRIRTKMKFEAKDSANGTIFDIFLESERNSDIYNFNLVMQGVKQF